MEKRLNEKEKRVKKRRKLGKGKRKIRWPGVIGLARNEKGGERKVRRKRG